MLAAASASSPSRTPPPCGAALSSPPETSSQGAPTAMPTCGRGQPSARRRRTWRRRSRNRSLARRSLRSRRRAWRTAPTRCSSSTRRSSPCRGCARGSRSLCAIQRASSGCTSGPPRHSRGRRSAKSPARTTAAPLWARSSLMARSGTMSSISISRGRSPSSLSTAATTHGWRRICGWGRMTSTRAFSTRSLSTSSRTRRATSQ
mmetsp:Transcript_1503/g.2989  ORF Transcript_1503/g.2989 Transcript_1503/m.2989 type:complete len:204 (-) Transcript_1503:90-701(-)